MKYFLHKILYLDCIFFNSHLNLSPECHPACQLCRLAACSKMPPHQSVCSTVYFFHYAVKTYFHITTPTQTCHHAAISVITINITI